MSQVTLGSFFKRNKSDKELKERYHFEVSESAKLGEGQFGKVYRGVKKDNGAEVAVKIINKKALSASDKEGLKQEISILSILHHDAIIKYFDSYDVKNQVYIITEMVKGGELFDRIVNKTSYSERDAATLVQRIAQALHYLHSNNIVHRDLKPENLLLISETDDTSVKLADFGFAAKCDEELEDSCGTLVYVAPEVLRGQGYRTEPDMWSLGVITYILLCGYPPFFDNDQETLAKKIIRGKYKFRSEDWDMVSEDAKDFIRKLLRREPGNRMTAAEVLEHPWIKNLAAISDKPLENNMQKELREFRAKEAMRKALHGLRALNNLTEMMRGFEPEGGDGAEE